MQPSQQADAEALAAFEALAPRLAAARKANRAAVEGAEAFWQATSKRAAADAGARHADLLAASRSSRPAPLPAPAAVESDGEDDEESASLGA